MENYELYIAITDFQKVKKSTEKSGPSMEIYECD